MARTSKVPRMPRASKWQCPGVSGVESSITSEPPAANVGEAQSHNAAKDAVVLRHMVSHLCAEFGANI